MIQNSFLVYNGTLKRIFFFFYISQYIIDKLKKKKKKNPMESTITCSEFPCYLSKKKSKSGTRDWTVQCFSYRLARKRTKASKQHTHAEQKSQISDWFDALLSLSGGNNTQLPYDIYARYTVQFTGYISHSLPFTN